MDWTTPSQTQRRERDRERARETVDGTCGGCRVAAYTETTRTQHDPVSIPVVQKHTNVTIFLRKRSFFLRETSLQRNGPSYLSSVAAPATLTLSLPAAAGSWLDGSIVQAIGAQAIEVDWDAARTTFALTVTLVPVLLGARRSLAPPSSAPLSCRCPPSGWGATNDIWMPWKDPWPSVVSYFFSTTRYFILLLLLYYCQCQHIYSQQYKSIAIVNCGCVLSSKVLCLSEECPSRQERC